MKAQTRIALTLTVFYIVLLVAIVCINWPSFSTLKPNEWGDFLAGSFGPLAFLWLVLGYFQQGKELNNNVEALKLQTEELKHSVEAQREMSYFASRQYEEYLESRRREEERRKLEIQPLFSIHFIRSAISGNTESYRAVIFNTGAICYAVSCIFRFGEETNVIVQFPVFDINSEGHHVNLNSNTFGGPLHDFEIQITYQDKEGDFSEIWFIVSREVSREGVVFSVVKK